MLEQIVDLSILKVALVYDWLDTNYGGAERVLLALKKLFPQADLFTSYINSSQTEWAQVFPIIKTTFLQEFPHLIKKNKASLSLLLPYAFETFDFKEYDLIISVTSFAGKGIITHPNQIHLCYLLTPTRFLYSHEHVYFKPLTHFMSRLPLNYLKKWDQVAIWRPDYLIAISQLVAKRAEKYYNRQVDGIIYPTITSPAIESMPKQKADYFLVLSRLVKYKQIELAILACGQLNLPLKIIGQGPELQNLKNIIEKHHWQNLIELLGTQTEKQSQFYLNQAQALIAPGLEDFGINLIEANQAGTLVIAHQDSGAMELLKPQMKISLPDENLDSLIQALAHMQKSPSVIVSSLNNNTQTFLTQFRQFIQQLYCTI